MRFLPCGPDSRHDAGSRVLNEREAGLLEPRIVTWKKRPSAPERVFPDEWLSSKKPKLQHEYCGILKLGRLTLVPDCCIPFLPLDLIILIFFGREI